MSETPKTDKELARCAHCWKGQAVSWHFAFDLELELNAANKRIEELERFNLGLAMESYELQGHIDQVGKLTSKDQVG